MSEPFTDDIDGLIRADPFVPFQIVLTSGTTYQVQSLLQVVLEKAKGTFYFPRSTRIAIFRLNQVATVETLDEGRPA